MSRSRSTATPSAGLGVDLYGGPTVDPTENVKDLQGASDRRQDDLRHLNNRYLEAKLECSKETQVLRAAFDKEIRDLVIEHQEALRKAEADRINSIRQVDREEVAKTAAAANTAIQTLATNTSTLAETLRNQVATTASAAEARLNVLSSDLNKRLSALELSSSEGKGKQLVSDPQMDKVAAMVEKLASSQSAHAGERKGMSNSAAIIVGAASLLGILISAFLGLLTIGGMLYAVMPHK